MSDAAQPQLLPFLMELRQRLMRVLLVLGVVFGILFYFANTIYTGFALPLLKHLSHGQGLIATNISAPFFVPVQLTFVFSLLLVAPFFLYQVWAFIAPALYVRERNLLWPLLCISTGLFYSGIAFVYFIVFPLLFKFLTQTAPRGVVVSPDIELYLDFALKLFFTFGLIFEVPVITILLIWFKVISREKLIKARSYVIVAAFVIGMLLAPPDVLSQTLLAVPFWLLFEAGIIFSRFFVP